MNIKAKYALIAWLIIAILFVTTILSQQKILANGFYWDNEWLLFCADQLLQGKQYYYDFFETNPPLIIVLYTPFIMFGTMFHIFHIAPIVLLQNFFFILIFALLWLNLKLLKSIFSKDNFMAYFTLVMIAMSELLMPAEAFSQREHLTLILFWPYLLVLVQRCQQTTLLKTPLFIFIGLLTSIGIALKAYFLIPLILMEVYYCVKTKKINTVFRPETLTILFMGLLYLLGLYVYFPQFYTHLLPLNIILYVRPFSVEPFALLMQGQPTLLLFTLFASLFFIYQIPKAKRDYYWLLMLATWGFFLVYLIPGQTWYYHLYPALALDYVLLPCLIIALFRAKMSVSIMIAGLMLFSIQMNITLQQNIYMTQHSIFSWMNKTIDLCDQHAAGKNILVLSPYLHTFYIPLKCHQATPTTRFPNLMLIRGIAYLQKTGSVQDYEKYKKIMFDLLDEDIHKKPPELLFIDNRGYYLTVNQHRIIEPLLPFLLSDMRFKQFFSQYTLIKKTRYFDIYHIS